VPEGWRAGVLAGIKLEKRYFENKSLAALLSNDLITVQIVPKAGSAQVDSVVAIEMNMMTSTSFMHNKRFA
jgi:hypothetical protein